jgi:signal transduction histidine kinase
VYLLPIISAATKFPGRDVVTVVAGSILAMIGFIVTGEQLTPFITHVKEFQDAVAAMVYFTMAGLLVYFFAQSEREQRERSQTLATNLAHSNDELRQTQTQLTERLAQLTKMEERLQQVSQMAVLGEMAGQVAHEVRNPLGIIKGSVEMLAERATDPAIRRYIEVVLEETNRLNKAVEGVLRLGAPLCLNKASVSLSTLLNSVVQVSFAWSVSERVSVDCAPISPGTVVQGDFDLLHQAFANLVRNACQAMPSGGIVKLSCDLQTDNQRVNIMIEDRGIGMAEDDLKRLGEPFFTKRKGGIGLGFSLAYRVIKEHGGALQVTSIQGRGTTVTISLPMSAYLHEEQLAGSSGRERI